MTEEGRLTTADLAGYRPERELGRGATGAVYLAASPGGEWMAVKRLVDAAPPDQLSLDLLRRQTERVVTLDHTRLVRVLDIAVAGADVCVVMEYVHGPNLRDVLSQQQLEPRQVSAWVADIAAGLDFLHAFGIVHGDVKPSNVIIAQSGEARLADFLQLPGQPLVRGTPAYMAPELARGDRAADGRSDVYSLACVAYEALTGLPPFPVDPAHPEEALRRHIRVPPPDPSQVLPHFPVATARALLKGLEKDPTARPATPGEFAAMLSAAVASGNGSIGSGIQAAPTQGHAFTGPGRNADPDRTLVSPLSSPLKAWSLAPSPPPVIKLGGMPLWAMLLLILLAMVGITVAGLGLAAHFNMINLPLRP